MMDGGEALKEIHKNNLDVVKYIQSDSYSKDEVSDYVDFFANNTEEQIAYLNQKKCEKCHGWRVGMLQTKSEWKSLSRSLVPLKKVHANNQEVLALINSESFKKTLPYFIKKISFHAKDYRRTSKQKRDKVSDSNQSAYTTYTFKTKSLNFIYKTKSGTKEDAKLVQRYLLKALKEHTFKKPLSITLIEGRWDTDAGNAFMFILTLSLAPVKRTKHIQLIIESDKKIYTAETMMTKSNGWAVKDKESRSMQTVISELLKEANMHIRNSKK
ncbi:hypothetical protein YH65_08175 [Sulfurovum lithotrophicum]|uniref:Uncharacterized protein n=2 Tax=Sulfurovum lithotrophicum TaxID=206403 RepID=A0A7U4M1X3_9BACT|nr:hypothetical protein YH65_08175 [Sulfurovum lithotrophicum]